MLVERVQDMNSMVPRALAVLVAAADNSLGAAAGIGMMVADVEAVALVVAGIARVVAVAELEVRNS